MSAIAAPATTDRQLFGSRYDSRHPLAYLRRQLDLLDDRPDRAATWGARHSCLRGAGTLQHLIARAHGKPLADDTAPTLARHEEVLRALIVEHLRGDEVATTCCLLALYPLLRSLIDPDEHDLAAELVAETLRALPTLVDHTGIAQRLKWILRQRRRALVVRTSAIERATSRRYGAWVWEAQLGGPVALTSNEVTPLGADSNQRVDATREAVWGLLLDARAAGVLSADDITLLIRVHGLDADDNADATYTTAARHLGISAEACRQRACRALRRIRTAIEDGTLALA